MGWGGALMPEPNLFLRIDDTALQAILHAQKTAIDARASEMGLTDWEVVIRTDGLHLRGVYHGARVEIVAATEPAEGGT